MKNYILVIVLLLVGIAGATYVANGRTGDEQKSTESGSMAKEPAGEVMGSTTTVTAAKAILAGGCFWCVESDLQKYTGVKNVISGYAGGSGDNPTYEDYAKRGFREAVEVTYDPTKVSYGNLVEYVIRHSDATDPDGSFHDRGPQYTSAAYYSSPEEKLSAETVVKNIDARKVYEKPLALYIIPTVKFWPAEDYHQDYAKKNPIRYSYYRSSSGRDSFIDSHWGKDTIPTLTPEISTNKNSMTNNTLNHPWEHFVKPSNAELKAKLTATEYSVTQEKGTETPFKNEYAENYSAGIYVDIVSGEPLYSSKDKFDSGTGWPSFVKPINGNVVVEKIDKGIFTSRTEIRSRIADSHLGHVFNDGPADRGGKRYCMNSAALRFIPKNEMEKSGYGDYLKYI